MNEHEGTISTKYCGQPTGYTGTKLMLTVKLSKSKFDRKGVKFVLKMRKILINSCRIKGRGKVMLVCSKKKKKNFI